MGNTGRHVAGTAIAEARKVYDEEAWLCQPECARRRVGGVLICSASAEVQTTEEVSFVTEGTTMKLFGILGATLVIVGFLGVSRPLLTATATLSESSEGAATPNTQGHGEQVLGGAAIIIGLALVSVELYQRK